jgi:predicted DNA-binding protein YlxM (UPF0122 family)
VSEDQSVERLSVGEAAEALGVTRDAIHNRISRGSIRHEKGEDGRLYVFVDTAATEPDTSTDALIEALDEMREQVRYLREQVQAEREAHAEARRLLLLALERIPPALESPEPSEAEPRESPTEATPQPGRVEPQVPLEGARGEDSSPLEAHEMAMPEAGGGPLPRDQQTPSERPWWRRVFGG